MNDNWRYTAKSITKYNPIYRDENGIYKNNEWIGFFQIGQVFDGNEFTLDSYLKTENKYIEAAIMFFEFHNCQRIVLKNVEKKEFFENKLDNGKELLVQYEKIDEGHSILLNNITPILQLILRDFIWAELFCDSSDDIAVRFGYDFYMYFNSDRTMDELFKKIKKLELFVN